MPLGSFRLNGIAKFTVTAVAEVIRRKKGITAIGNAQVDTAQSKFGGSSALFDGSGDYLVVEHSNTINFGSNDFTLECWYRPTSRATGYPVILSNYPDYSPGANTWVLLDRHNDVNNTKFTFFVWNFNSFSTSMLTSTTSVSNGNWYHIAITRNANTWRMFINGTLESTQTSSVSLDGTATPKISVGRSNVSNTEINGHVDEFRISNTARYTANFTAPTAPFQNDSNTLLLLHMDGTDASTVFQDDNGRTPT